MLAMSAYQENGTVGPRPRLNIEWAILKWWISDSSAIGRVFAGLLMILGVGIQIAAKLHTKIWSLLLISLICLTGIGAAIVFLSYGNDPNLDIFKQFRSVVEQDAATVSESIKTVINITIGWLVSFMAAQLGISLLKSEGALKQLTN